ncbi:glycosyltransferase [Pseudohoeflea suaedae]|uniref:Glycosyltransferase n=1 Tax=Pseudohoeflea suaedae TaxID=877384 RepID=A0A4R5PQ35_9HYPH|nr:glycosyltransferase [Pseudohoeflea suaedae]TDH38737.1 glycosyltransferase [Pseudohoeflea suaedae]
MLPEFIQTPLRRAFAGHGITPARAKRAAKKDLVTVADTADLAAGAGAGAGAGRAAVSQPVPEPEAAARLPAPRGHLDMVIRCPDDSVIVVGWALPSGSPLLMVEGAGTTACLTDSFSSYRPDLTGPFGGEFGPMAAYGGFILRLPRQTTAPASVALSLASSGRIIHSVKAEQIGAQPIELARRLFSVDTPPHLLTERFSTTDLPAIAAAMKENERIVETYPVERWQFGEAPVAPATSLIIPLYARWDFVEHQLLAFSRDADILSRCEIIYVVDDPNILPHFLAQARELSELYGVAFTIVWGQVNRGYAGANNLGAGQARGDKLILMNSDVIPDAPGWAATLTDLLDANPGFGVIAPRLMFPDGGIQHAGMAFQWDARLQVWLNDHPLLGLPREADPTVGLSERQAVTGACMVLRRREFEELGRFDTGYLIGDFEDSDLCLKYRERGLLPGYCADVELTHLERQSLRSAGDPGFRQKVTILNAVRHQERWGATIARLAGGGLTSGGLAGGGLAGAGLKGGRLLGQDDGKENRP